MARIRRAARAGTFYEATEPALRAQIEWCFRHPQGPGEVPAVDPAGPRRLAGLVVPHAGYAYSGPVAAHAYAALAADGAPDLAVLVGPNHYGLGPTVAVSLAEGWQTPLGVVAGDYAVAQAIVAGLPGAAASELAHEQEHSLEVQLPFLQYLYGDSLRLVAIAVSRLDRAAAEALGRAIATALAGRNAVVIATSDLSHYESQRVAEAKDGRALEAILAGDRALLMRLAGSDVSMCGAGPVVAALTAASRLEKAGVELLKYATSGDVAGDSRQVVGYAALALGRS
jgi:MEMO1 family protein